LLMYCDPTVRRRKKKQPRLDLFLIPITGSDPAAS
jgi:hypothetical protein